MRHDQGFGQCDCGVADGCRLGLTGTGVGVRSALHRWLHCCSTQDLTDVPLQCLESRSWAPIARRSQSASIALFGSIDQESNAIFRRRDGPAIRGGSTVNPWRAT
jgi:hypothetical protein